MASPPVVGLEIGTSKVLALVGEEREGGQIMITGMGKHPSAGVRKGETIDLENAAVCARAAVQAAEETSKVAIRQVHLAISGGHIRSLVNRGTVPVLGKGGEITQDDIDQVMDVARAVNLPAERQVLHTICQHFWIDEEERVVKPEGLEGARLAVDMLVLHGVRNRLRNTVKVAREIPMEVQDVAFSGLCSALAVLTPEQKKSGAIVVDLGGGTTEYVAYAGNVLAAAGGVGVGGDHVTNDIALAFNIPVAQAERLKVGAGSAIVDSAGSAQRVSLPAEVGFPGRSVSLRSLHTVMGARMDEILRMIVKEMEGQNMRHQVGAGVILTGGGSHMKGIEQLVTKVFGLPCTVGKPRNVSGLATATEGPEYATAVGMVAYGFRSLAAQRARSGLGGFQKNLFGR